MSLQKTNVEEIRTALVRIRVSEVSETSSKAAEPGSTATMVLTASPHQKPLCSTDAGPTATDIHQHLQACAMATALKLAVMEPPQTPSMENRMSSPLIR